MRVLVAGATGAIGSPLIAALLAADHHVTGMCRTTDGVSRLRARGADTVMADALDAKAVEAAVRKSRPQIVIDELTSLPKYYTPAAMQAAAEGDRRLRLEGGAALHRAARAAGVLKYIVQSTGFFYGPGPGLATETEPLALAASPSVASASRIYADIEQRVLETPDLPGIALRYGFFYGPGTWNTEHGSLGDAVRRRERPIVGDGNGVWSFVHVRDAAAATVAAIDAEPGVYNIVDDDPTPIRDWLTAFARAIGAPDPARVPADEALTTLGPDAVYYGTRLRGADNTKAKRVLRFTPRPLEWLHHSARHVA
jgi:2-alkyl-3-oxoalkanoate reductase